MNTSSDAPRKKRRRALALVISIMIMLVIVAGCSSPSASDKSVPQALTSNGSKATVFQSPNCGCCEKYKDYLRGQGFQVTTIYTEDMSSIKKKYQIPKNMESCHTMIIGDYFIEGHVPMEAITELFEEKPDVDGIALPGMPAGPLGMPGQQTEAFIIYAISDGIAKEFMSL